MTIRPCLPRRVPVVFSGKSGRVVLDRLRTVDRKRLVRRLGALDPSASREIRQILAPLFAP